MNCAKHPDQEASGICVHCGKFFCSACLVEVDGKNYCRGCLSERFAAYQTTFMASDRSKSTALLLCIFLGYFGAHYFYTRKAGMGLLYFFTVGLFGIGWLVDIARIASGSFTDSFGLPVLYNNPLYEARYQMSMDSPIQGQPIDSTIPGRSSGAPFLDDVVETDGPDTYPVSVTWESYCRISSGMSYQEVCMLLGQEGIHVASPNPRVQSYQWNGADNHSYALLRFSNGTLVEKEQRGLR